MSSVDEEKKAQAAAAAAATAASPAEKAPEDEDEDANIDQLVMELQSNQGDEDEEEEEEEGEAKSSFKQVPENLLQTDPSIGLTDSEVQHRTKKFGYNEMAEQKQNLFIKFCGYFVGPIQFVMEAAALLALGLEDWVDFGVICALLLLNAGVGFIQEFQAGSIVDELKKTLANTAVAVRNGQLVNIEARDVVPGDILKIEDGTVIPADGKLVTEECFLQVDQSAITGESLAVDKHFGDPTFSSSTVKRGEALMLVTATGDSTFVGRAASLVNKAAGGTGHFTEVLNGIGTMLLILVIATLLLMWVACFYRTSPIVRILRFTLAITIVGVPVGLPAVVTTTMAVGAAYLAKKKAIVQKLSAIESLAGVEILCSDKTGTLTKNKLSLHEPYTVEGVEPDDLMLTACLAASRKKKGLDAIDKAFLKSLISYPKARAAMAEYKVLEFQPFDPVSKKVTAVVESPEGEQIVCVKGAPLFVLKTVQEDHPIPEDVLEAYENKVAEFASRGFRSLGVARKRSEGHWEILGIMPCMDPPRDDTAKTVNEAKRLGLRIKMLTGDAVGIAKETCRQLGLGTNIYDAEKLGLGGEGGGDMAGSELYDFVENADGFAEVFPQHKYNVVAILQERGFLVAMTGDGVNDAPSLKKADTGIAVEGASDAARSAADIVFLAPGLSAIIDALKTSRQIFHRMYAYVVYRIALSLHLEIFYGLWVAILDDMMDINLVVFIAIFADVATLAIAYDNAPYSMKPVNWDLPRLWGMSVIMGIILAVGSWITLTTMFLPKGGIIQNFGSIDGVLFLQISLTENWLIFITRAVGPFWSSVPSWQLAGAVLSVDIIATCFCLFGWWCQNWTDIVTVVRVYLWSFGVFSVLGGAYYLMSESEKFDRLMNGKPLSNKPPQRSIEDFMVAMRRVSTQHEKSS
ncbi:DEKNAAC103803 [Brettanomyces naardenensis]|uniref:Plasma membrane ATPase n=1 Tax=Brettanomyces naardenensis TaxID=13370 RepID=A0A448YPC5_BRENA|nr:DEKNAAC103803 [Brettanomyces naardenensis]